MATDLDRLTELLAEWLPRQRWFGGKGRPMVSCEIVVDETVVDDDPGLHLLLVRVDYEAGSTGEQPHEDYQVLLGLRSEDIDRFDYAAIGMVEDRLAYDAAHDPPLVSALLQSIADGRTVGSLRFANVGEALDSSLQSRVLGNEQSNTSLVYGDDYILKVFRKIGAGLNPDLEITRALADIGSKHIARPLGWYEGTLADGSPTTLGLMQEFLRFGSEGWTLATISVRDLYAEGDLHADEVGGDFAAEADRLGQATAEVHRDLARALETGTLQPAQVDAIGTTMTARLDAACQIVPELRPHHDAIADAYAALGSRTGAIEVQRIHGDFHLGQTMRTETGWVLLDFEGEPARSLEERRALSSPLQDVAGMLRSFDYAARHLLMEQLGEKHLAYRAVEWAERNRSAFLDGYARAMGRDPRDDGDLLRAYELDKAVYEVVYEARNRPTWLSIPLGTIERLAG